MNRVDEILILAERGIPQALARFNDGEVGIMFNKDFTAARGDQKGSIELQVSLLDSIKHKQENYWKGYPCPICMKKQRDQLRRNFLNSLRPRGNFIGTASLMMSFSQQNLILGKLSEITDNNSPGMVNILKASVFFNLL